MTDSVKINGKDFKVKKSFRSLFIFEQISGKAFKVETTLDNFIFLYSVLLSGNREETLEWEEFMDAVDADPGIIDRMNEILGKVEEIDKLLSAGEDEKGQDEKKN